MLGFELVNNKVKRFGSKTYKGLTISNFFEAIFNSIMRINFIFW